MNHISIEGLVTLFKDKSLQDKSFHVEYVRDLRTMIIRSVSDKTTLMELLESYEYTHYPTNHGEIILHFMD